jgi:16S rRNA (cytosine1402-N4)-methyltransferase
MDFPVHSETQKNEGMNKDKDTGQDYHIPVLLKETIEGLNINPGGIYVDCTFGGGGHSRSILEKLNDNGRLIAFDQDADAQKNLPDDKRISFVPHNFRHLARFLKLHNCNEVDGILADLGVSSHQFNQPERGFSTRFDAELDMRMDTREENTALKILMKYSKEDLQKIFSEYGEITNAKTLATLITEIRNNRSIQTVNQFKDAVSNVVKGNPHKYFAQVFQALRIEVNDELGALKEMLLQVPDALKQGGRIAVITFHSLEDRLVKNFLKHGSFEQKEDIPFIQTES